jgi:hypothetical protein
MYGRGTDIARKPAGHRAVPLLYKNCDKALMARTPVMV